MHIFISVLQNHKAAFLRAQVQIYILVLIRIYTQEQFIPSQEITNELIEFLHTHLDQYGDDKASIAKAIAYVKDRGGKIFILRENEQAPIAGASVVNDTGMSGYIPDHILVYIAVDASYRGKGFGKQLMSTIMEDVKGDIALHVDFENEPATRLYEKLGFKKKYYEMRLIREK